VVISPLKFKGNLSSLISDSYKYGEGPIPFRKFDWKRRSKELQDIISRMLEMDPKKRLSTAELLEHPWFETE
jgi:serine/threonine protein kinase